MPDTADTDTIHPAALRVARKRRGMTQQQLAESIRCTKDTVSRWERGTSRRVRSHLRKPLCDVLRVKWESLTEPPLDKREDALGDARINVSIGKDERNSLHLVARRYDIEPRDVLKIAPLLFLIVAERSLLARGRRLNQIDAIWNETGEKLRNNCGHLGGIVAARSASADDAWEHEDVSVGARDIFGRILGHGVLDDRAGPFVYFVRDLAKDLPEDAVTCIDSFGGDMIDMYRIAENTLRECTGISGDEEGDENLLRHLRDGGIDLAECLRIRRSGEETAYRQWLSDAATRAEEEARGRALSINDF